MDSLCTLILSLIRFTLRDLSSSSVLYFFFVSFFPYSFPLYRDESEDERLSNVNILFQQNYCLEKEKKEETFENIGRFSFCYVDCYMSCSNYIQL